ncbi:hypothetical protein BSKO_08220 [Bryopsis sp. KO-2023]|nr:hypothetical protein BSKO_08220 [Bryopsis sp. KO-2023]
MSGGLDGVSHFESSSNVLGEIVPYPICNKLLGADVNSQTSTGEAANTDLVGSGQSHGQIEGDTEKKRLVREIDRLSVLVEALTTASSNEVVELRKANARLESTLGMLQLEMESMRTKNDDLQKENQKLRDLKVLDDKFQIVEDLKPSSKPCKKAIPKVILPVALCPECKEDQTDGGSKEKNDKCVKVTMAGAMGAAKLFLVFEADQDWGAKIVSIWKGKDSGIKESRSEVKIFQILPNKSLKALLPKLSGYEQSDPLVSTIKDSSGVNPGEGGKTRLNLGLHISNSVQESNELVVYVPPPFAAKAVLEVVGAEIDLIACNQAIPRHEMVRVKKNAMVFPINTRLMRPNYPGTIKPGECKIEIMPGDLLDSTQMVIVTDGKLVRPGEALHVKDFVLKMLSKGLLQLEHSEQAEDGLQRIAAFMIQGANRSTLGVQGVQKKICIEEIKLNEEPVDLEMEGVWQMINKATQAVDQKNTPWQTMMKLLSTKSGENQIILNYNARDLQSKAIAYGTQMMSRVTPGKGNKSQLSLPVVNIVRKNKAGTRFNSVVVCDSPSFAAKAVLEAVGAEIDLVVCITEGFPQFNMGYIHQPDKTGIVSQSGTLVNEAIFQTAKKDHRRAMVVGIDNDPFYGTKFIDALLKKFVKDPQGILLSDRMEDTQVGKIPWCLIRMLNRPIQDRDCNIIGLLTNCLTFENGSTFASKADRWPMMLPQGLDNSIFNTVQEPKATTGFNTSMVYDPPSFPEKPVLEAVGAEMDLAVCIPQDIPQHDMASFQTAKKSHRQAMVVGIDGNPFHGTKFIDALLKKLVKDPQTVGKIMIGEIDRSAEKKAIKLIKASGTKKSEVSFIAGLTAAPPGLTPPLGRPIGGKCGTILALQAAGYMGDKYTDLEEQKKNETCQNIAPTNKKFLAGGAVSIEAVDVLDDIDLKGKVLNSKIPGCSKNCNVVGVKADIPVMTEHDIDDSQKEEKAEEVRVYIYILPIQSEMMKWRIFFRWVMFMRKKSRAVS